MVLQKTDESGVTFYVKDLTDNDTGMLIANASHKLTGPYVAKSPLVIGGRDGPAAQGWDGLIDELRLSNAALKRDELFFNEGEPESVVARWEFESRPGIYKDSASKQPDLLRTAVSSESSAAVSKLRVPTAALVDFCHVLLNSSEFLYVD